MKTVCDLFIGIPTWNSELFLETCLTAVKRTTDGLTVSVHVLDNLSQDRTTEIAADHGCEIHQRPCHLPDAFNYLIENSKARCTLLIHADTVLLAEDWFDICSSKLVDNCILVSPQDIGCGPFTRPWGMGMPESSFMLFNTRKLRNLRQTRWVRRFRMPFPRRVIDFYTPNVTHHLPERLIEKGFKWKMMRVIKSPLSETPIWKPGFQPHCWSNELSFLNYGLGNFYSLDGKITHYHNWFERIVRDVPNDSEEADEKQGGLPLAYISEYTKRFLADYHNDCLQFPDPLAAEQAPKALAVRDQIKEHS